MSGTTKYTPAPQEDPDAHIDYTQPPPSYQAESSAAQDQDLLLGGPRNSEDNIPDDFKVGFPFLRAAPRYDHIKLPPLPLLCDDTQPSVADHLLVWRFRRRSDCRDPQPIHPQGLHHPDGAARRDSCRKLPQLHERGLQDMGPEPSRRRVDVGMFPLPPETHGRPPLELQLTHPLPQLLGSMVFMGLTYWKRHSYPTNLLFLSGFTLLEAYTISVIVSFYKTSIVLNAVLLTAGIFVFLTAFACQTKYDFTSWMPYLFGALWGLILFGFMSFFLPHSSTTELVYGLFTALIFSGYILVDTQLVLRKHHVEEEIAAAISLYLDIINLFLAILRILNSQSNN